MSQNTREILTLQFGNYANYVGAHWWNIQESSFQYDPTKPVSEINHDILYREGKNRHHQVTYTPRLLLVDLNGSLKHVSPVTGDDLYPEPHFDVATTSIWDQKIEVIKKPKIDKPQFLLDLEYGCENDDENIESDDDEINMANDTNDKPKLNNYNFRETVETWTDFMYSRYHPRSINILNQIEHSIDENSLDCFTAGASLWTNESFDDSFGDKIRQYIEECNNCQGFQTLFDCTTGFSGLTIKCLEYLTDEYGAGKAQMAVPIFSPKSMKFHNTDKAMSDSIRVINTAMSYTHLIDKCSAILPLSTKRLGWRSATNSCQFPLVNYSDENLYETSAILATFLDTISLKYRLKNNDGGTSLAGFCGDVTNCGRKLTAAAMSLPFQMTPKQYLIDCLDQLDIEELFTTLSPQSKIGTDRIVQSVCVRGIPESRLKKPLTEAKESQMKMAAYRCGNVQEMFSLYFQCSLYASLSHVSTVSDGMSTRIPYPIELFDRRINPDGFVTDFNLPAEQKFDIKSLPVMAAVQSSTKLSDTICGLHREASRLKIQKLHRFRETGLENDEYVEILDQLLQFQDNYDDNLML